MNLNLGGKTAVITGAAKGMGPTITAAFAREACRIAVLGRDEVALDRLAASLQGDGATIMTVACDIVDASACERAASAVADRLGQAAILVNLAGGTGPIGKSGLQTDPDEFDAIMDINVKGAFNVIRSFAPQMVAAGCGKIINVGGTYGMRGRAGRLAYSSSKWSLRGLTKSFALELGSSNINVNCVAPGVVDGPRFRERVCPQIARERNISLEAAVLHQASEFALCRITQAEDVANACLFLASDASRQITGIDLPVDGGWAAL